MLQSQTCPKCTVYVVLHPSPQRKYRQQLRGRNLTGGKWLGCNKDNRGLKEGRKNPSFAAVWRKTLHAGFHAVQRSLCLCWRRKRLKKRLIILSEASCFISIPWAASSLRYTYGNCMLFLEICVVFFFFFFSNLREMWVLIEVKRLMVCATVRPSGSICFWKFPLPASMPSSSFAVTRVFQVPTLCSCNYKELFSGVEASEVLPVQRHPESVTSFPPPSHHLFSLPAASATLMFPLESLPGFLIIWIAHHLYYFASRSLAPSA